MVGGVQVAAADPRIFNGGAHGLNHAGVELSGLRTGGCPALHGNVRPVNLIFSAAAHLFDGQKKGRRGVGLIAKRCHAVHVFVEIVNEKFLRGHTFTLRFAFSRMFSFRVLL